MSSGELHILVPGPIDQRTGGYIYDARMVQGLRHHGWDVEVHSLPGDFPLPNNDAVARALASIPDNSCVLLDGLTLAATPEAISFHRGRLRLIALVHHPLSDETGLPLDMRELLMRLERQALRAVSGVIVTSHFTAGTLKGFGVSAARIRVVEPGVDRVDFAEGPGLNEPPELLVVGAVIPRKGHDVLVRALSSLRHYSWHCICAGSVERDRPYAELVVESINHNDLVGRIEFVHECDASTLDELYRRASVFVLPSHYEGYGMVLAEALVRGLPIISTTGGAIPDTVPPEAGTLVPPGNSEALSGAIRSFIDGSNGATTRTRCALAARRYAETMASWESAVSQMENAVVELT